MKVKGEVRASPAGTIPAGRLAEQLARLGAQKGLEPGDGIAQAVHQVGGDGPDAVVSDLLRQRDQLQEQIAFSRQVYNHAADAYNQAIALFPTTLVASLLRFHRAPEFPPI